MERRRRLSKSLRRVNLIYKILMVFLSVASLILATFTDTHSLYYQIVSVFSSAFPILWSQILDACKQYEDDKTPTASPEPSDTPNQK